MSKGIFFSVKDRIFKYSVPEPNTGCWLWTGSTRRHNTEKVKERIKLENQKRSKYKSMWYFKNKQKKLMLENNHE